ncbi:phosphatidylinositol glycan, class T [Babesia microti strain RI]|uniref:Phosphatidylinositol glycan, class T n=1 Tax=Babesia microti (strain RI) TaxID=1133968 RepID=I7JAP8_BABMR|nr:phosphatidylinositol glycan, class T [Babesia microti strain RI]CCF73889.1 phosphatidylinositol glycan, class T [Babesia microti strain RI]|eukprot:XP_012648498.1 phosphatidylinositol glycan, class T [Babesia microti strain RI]
MLEATLRAAEMAMRDLATILLWGPVSRRQIVCSPMMLGNANKRGENILETSNPFNPYHRHNGVAPFHKIYDETSTGENGSSRRDSSSFQTDSPPSTDNLMEKFAFNNLKLELENTKNTTAINTIGEICNEHITKFANSDRQGTTINNLEEICNHLQKIKNHIESDISLLKCEKSLLDSPSSTILNTVEYISPRNKLDHNYSNSFASNEILAGTENTEAQNSDQEDALSFLKITTKQSTKGELLRSAIPIDTMNNDIKSQKHFTINRYKAFVNTFAFLSDLASVGVSIIKLVKGDSLEEWEKGSSPLVYFEPIIQDATDYISDQPQISSKKRFVLRLRKEAFDKPFLDSLPLKGKLKLMMKNSSSAGPGSAATPTNDITAKDFTPPSHSDILYLDTIKFQTILNLLPQADPDTQLIQEVLTLEISPLDIFLGTFPSFEHVEVSIYLPYLPSTHSDVNFELWDIRAATRVGTFLSTRQRMINRTLRAEASAYKKQAELNRQRQLLIDAKIRTNGWYDIFAWGCLPVRAIDSPDQFVPLPAGYCHGDKEFPYNNAAKPLSEAAEYQGRAGNDKRNVWMQSSYFNLTGAPLFWRNSAIMEMGARCRPIEAGKPIIRCRRDRGRKADQTMPSPSTPTDGNDEPVNYPIDTLNCRQGNKFTLYRRLFSLENVVRVGNTLNRDKDPIFTYYEKNINSVWTFAQVRTFIIKYLLYPKNFIKIASFLDSKSVGDCIDFYYKFKYKLRLKERLADIKLRSLGATIIKSKQDIKRHQKRDFHLIDALFSDQIPRGLFSPISWPPDHATYLDNIICADALYVYSDRTPRRLFSQNSWPNDRPSSVHALDWRRLYHPLYHLDNLREGYFLPIDVNALFTTQPLVVPTSYLPTNPHVLTLRGSIHLNRTPRPADENCVDFAVCYALAELARFPPDTSRSMESSINEGGQVSIPCVAAEEKAHRPIDNQPIDGRGVSRLSGVAWKLMDPIPPITALPDYSKTQLEATPIVGFHSRLLEAIPVEGLSRETGMMPGNGVEPLERGSGFLQHRNRNIKKDGLITSDEECSVLAEDSAIFDLERLNISLK